jgi:hypothetical protein
VTAFFFINRKKSSTTFTPSPSPYELYNYDNLSKNKTKETTEKIEAAIIKNSN